MKEKLSAFSLLLFLNELGNVNINISNFTVITSFNSNEAVCV